MSASAERWSRADARLASAAFAAVVFLVSWGLIHRGFYAEHTIVDTPTYQAYGDRVMARLVPYRDFAVEYPPGALPVFVVPSLFPVAWYATAFAWEMAVLGVATLVLVALIRPGAEWFVAIAPLLVGSLILSRFDLWPAALTVAALWALLGGRDRLGWALLGGAVAAKLYPAVLIPLALAWTWRRLGRREALVGTGIAVGVVAVVSLPFLVLAPSGLWHSLSDQGSRPLQIESLGAALLKLFGNPAVESSHGSQNVAGHHALASLFPLLQLVLLAALWIAYARGPADRERLLRYAAACVCAFVAFGKVLSPQFLIWLVPLVPLVRGVRGIAATALLALALVLTQVWFPRDYWQYVNGDAHVAVVVLRNLALVALLAVLALPLPRLAPRR